VVPISDYIYKLKTQMMTNRRDGLIDLIASEKIHKEIDSMVSIQNEFHMSSIMEE